MLGFQTYLTPCTSDFRYFGNRIFLHSNALHVRIQILFYNREGCNKKIRGLSKKVIGGVILYEKRKRKNLCCSRRKDAGSI